MLIRKGSVSEKLQHDTLGTSDLVGSRKQEFGKGKLFSTVKNYKFISVSNRNDITNNKERIQYLHI